MKRLLPVLCLCSWLIAAHSFGGSATWLATPVDDKWHNPANWTTGGPPRGPSDTAIFSFSTVTDVSCVRNTEVSELAFDAGASPFTITIPYTRSFTVLGTGITNNSGVTQTFAVPGFLYLKNNAALDNVTIEPALGAGFNVQFSQNASAGNATFILDPGGVIFVDRATAVTVTSSVTGTPFAAAEREVPYFMIPRLRRTALSFSTQE